MSCLLIWVEYIQLHRDSNRATLEDGKFIGHNKDNFMILNITEVAKHFYTK